MYEWKVESVRLDNGKSEGIETLLQRVENGGWEVFAVIQDAYRTSGGTFYTTKVVARRGRRIQSSNPLTEMDP